MSAKRTLTFDLDPSRRSWRSSLTGELLPSRCRAHAHTRARTQVCFSGWVVGEDNNESFTMLHTCTFRQAFNLNPPAVVSRVTETPGLGAFWLLMTTVFVPLFHLTSSPATLWPLLRMVKPRQSQHPKHISTPLLQWLSSAWVPTLLHAEEDFARLYYCRPVILESQKKASDLKLKLLKVKL